MGRATVTNSTFAGDIAFSGGEIFNDATAIGGAVLAVTNSTFSANAASIGSGIANIDPAIAALKGSILSRNIHFPNCEGTITDKGYNISTDVCGFGSRRGANGRTIGDNIGPDLSFAGLQNNGGPTQTIALAPGSPAVGAIPYARCTDQGSPPVQITTDQRGYYRPFRPRGPCDIGAFQLNATPPVIFVVGITRIFPGVLNLDPGVGQCPVNGGFVGTFSFTAELTNESDSTLSGLGAQVVRLTGGNFLQTGNPTAGGKNAYQTIPLTLGPSAPTDEALTISPTLAPGSRTQVPFTVCLEQVEPFELSVDVLGTSSQAIAPRRGRRSFQFQLDPLESCRDDDPKHERECND